MREINFRAWEKAAHSNGMGMMWQSDDTFSDYVLTFDGRVLEKFVDSFAGESFDNYRDVTAKFEVMQYTGLKDKIGKDIYEGDIVRRFPAYDGDREEIVAVEWLKSQAAFYPFGRGDFSWAEIEKFEVIGNIYENPELVEAE